MSGFGWATLKPEGGAVPHPWEGYVPLKRKQELLRARLRAHQLEIVGLTRASAKYFALEEAAERTVLGELRPADINVLNATHSAGQTPVPSSKNPCSEEFLGGNCEIT